jgi:tetratricopeptide (TPR) repeat protein
LSRPRSLRKLALVVPLLGVAGAASALSGRWARAEAPAARLSEVEVLELDLAFFEARVARDSFAARDHAQLARLHLQRAPIGGNEGADLAQAETHARRSLALRTAHNSEALQVLASTLMGSHRFAEARDAAERLVAMDSTSRGARALLGEIELELGAYPDAARTFGSLLTVREELGIAPRYARWEEIRGRPAEAKRLLRRALADASSRHGMPRSHLAWFHWRLGDLALRHGRPDEAERELHAGLALAPEDHRLLDGMARVALARGRWREAIDFGEQATARTPDPVTLGLLSVSWEMLGDSARSAEHESAMDAAVAQQPTGLNRQWAMLQLDRGRDVAGVLAKARDEIGARRDIYAWDLLSWALYRSGEVREALGASARALAMNTRDASLFFHAGMIAAAAGDTALARGRLREALEINPRWDPNQPDQARAVLNTPVHSSARVD